MGFWDAHRALDVVLSFGLFRLGLDARCFHGIHGVVDGVDEQPDVLGDKPPFGLFHRLFGLDYRGTSSSVWATFK